MLRLLVALVVAGLLAGCGSARADRRDRVTPEPMTARVGGLYVGPLRVIPLAAGECVGWVEVTIVNEGSAPAQVGSLSILQPDEPSGSVGRGAEAEVDGPLFEMYDTIYTSLTLEPGGSRVLRNPIVRVRRGVEHPVRLRGQALAFSVRDVCATLTTEPVSVDLAEWPVHATLTREALDLARAAGHEVHIVFSDHALPHGGWSRLEVRPDRSAHGEGSGRQTDPHDFEAFSASGPLTPTQQDALRAFVMAAPFEAFRVDPQSRRVMDGHVVNLLVAAGPAAFASWSQERDFRAAGLVPLLRHLRGLLRELPEIPADD